MKKICLLILIAIQFILIYGLTEPYYIFSNQIRNDVKNLNKFNISIDNVDNNGLRVYINENEFLLLKDLGYEPIKLFNEAREYSYDKHSKNYQYYTYDQYIDFMYETAQNFPEICSLYVAGYSVQNREILFIKISDNPNQNNNKPKVKLISTIHGDEVVGYDMLIRFIQLLTSEYNTNPEINFLVNNTEFWINPLSNPDGYVAQERQNANGVDLNRNFPDFLYDTDCNPHNREPEIAVQMLFSQNFKTHLAANFHGGAVVINYPWDTTYTLFPDNDLVIDLSLAYASLNPTMTNSSEFPNGITNGAQWYVIHGSFQDWDNYYNQVFHVTAEISQSKWPNPSLLSNFWLNNKDSILNYSKRVHRAFSGIVKNEEGLAIPAKISLQDYTEISNDNETGYFNRLVLPGVYEFGITSYGYESITLNDIVITETQGYFTEITLNNLPLYSLHGRVMDTNNMPLDNVSIEILETNIPVITTDENGQYLISEIFQGEYDALITYNNSKLIYDIIISQNNTNYDFILSNPEFTDDFETVNNLWTLQNHWNYMQINNNTVLADSPDNYNNNINSSATLNQTFYIPNDSPANVGFDVKYSLEQNYDFAFFEIYSNNLWHIAESFTGSSDWLSLSYPLNDFRGQTVKFRFRINTDQSVTDEGIYIDNFYVNTGSYSVNISDNSILADTHLIDITHYPNPITSSENINFILEKTSPKDLKLSIFNVKGQKVKEISIPKNTKRISSNLSNTNTIENLSSGVYFYRISGENINSKAKKMIILK